MLLYFHCNLENYVRMKTKRTAIEQYAIDRVREKRQEAKMTQADLASEAGYSYGFIGHVETISNKKYNLNHLNAFAKVFNCKVKDFLPDDPL